MKRHKAKMFGLIGMIALCFCLMFGCAFNKAQRMGDLESGNYDHALILNGKHDVVAKCFVAYEKKNFKSAIKLEKSIQKSMMGASTTSGIVSTVWEATTFSQNGNVVTRVLCREHESLVLDYRYVVDFIQINPTEVRIEFYGRKYTTGWQDMGCGTIVAEIDELITAAKFGELETVTQLMDRFSDQNTIDEKPDNVGRIALKHAAENGHVGIVDLLIKRGVNVDAANVDDTTPLKAASERGHLEIVKLLLANGADVNAKNDFGRTALQQASGNGHFEIVMLLLENGADVNARTKRGYSALLQAALKRHSKVMLLLLENGAVATHTGKGGYTALHGAAQTGHIELAELLLDKGARVNARSSTGSTPLLNAVLYRNLEMVKLLLESGADVNIKDKRGKTPLMRAGKNNSPMRELLLAYGAKK